MEIQINDNRLVLMMGDITKQTTGAIVNAANGSLLGGGGVDGAIHRAAGNDLYQECRRIRMDVLNGDNLPTGDSVITKGYNLPAKHVIHTVGPVWRGGANHEEVLLANCYRNSLMLAMESSLNSISFPSISTGIFSFPIVSASKVALNIIVKFLQENHFGEVVMVLFSKDDFEIYKSSLEEILNGGSI